MTVKRAESNNELQKTGSGCTRAWTEEEDAALLEGLDKYGPGFDRIKAEDGALLRHRTIKALETRCYQSKNNQLKEKYRELKAAIPTWTKQEDAALFRGFKKHGHDWVKIHETESVLSKRKPKSTSA
ncbi:hypothetical protein TrLO_g4136 [Triparma laevis f. longispina]|uniref:Myb-like domain-containing protein n=1 Tax=Triparma laevis f. longispina TaxID=1714387 RepID=A0A9W7FMW2_9STRA|nr:hypothetical protein TrLO_g4136 [Triparma laevis f. longispina]